MTGFLTNYVFFSDVSITSNIIYEPVNISNCSPEIINNTIVINNTVFVEKECNCNVNDNEEINLEEDVIEYAEEFAKLYLEEDLEELYKIIPKKTQEIMEEVKFFELYKPVIYGIRSVYLDTGEVLTSLNKQPYKTMYVDDVVIKENIAFVNYSTRDLKDNVSNTIRQFVLEDDVWKPLDFNIIAEGGCVTNSDCMKNDDFLRDTCIHQCQDFRFMALLKENSYECKDNFCHCKCFNTDTKIGRNIKADVESKYR
ncbi:hypothetical protein KY334_03650 [Candidatus Woesearchaeota archaeon]|nr:hypothetical protein [Candidatus Woesearchaeota archaeon]